MGGSIKSPRLLARDRSKRDASGNFRDGEDRTTPAATNLLGPLRGQKKCPAPIAWSRAYTWRRPTLTGPIVPLPSALQRFTSGFGMGPGGSTALWSPEGNTALSVLDSEDLSYGFRRDCGSQIVDALLNSSSTIYYLLSLLSRAFARRPLSDIHTEKSNTQNLIISKPFTAFLFLIPKTGIKPNG